MIIERWKINNVNFGLFKFSVVEEFLDNGIRRGNFGVVLRLYCIEEMEVRV